MFLNIALCSYFLIVVISTSKVSGVEFTPEKGKLSVKEGGEVTLEWNCNFPPPTGGEYVHIFFKAKDKVKEIYPLAVVSERNPRKNTRNTHFSGKISVTIQSQSNSFVLFIEILKTSIDEEGTYTINRGSIDGLVGTTTNDITLEVIVPPFIKKSPKTMSAVEYDDVSFECLALAGNPKPLTFQWYFRRKDEHYPKEPIKQQKENDRFSYNVSNVGYTSIGFYKCVVSNGNDSDSHEITLSVKHKPFVLTEKTMNITVFESDGTKYMYCDVVANPSDNIKYHWYKGTAQVEIKSNTQSMRIENHDTRLTFVNPSRKLAMKYYCAGENSLGTGKRKGGFLNVTYIPDPIDIATSVNNVVNGDEGSNMSVICFSDANPPPTYTWTKLVRSAGLTKEIKMVENLSGELKLNNVQINATADYKCTAFNFPNSERKEQRYSSEKIIKIKINYGPLRTNITANGWNQSHKEVQVAENDPVEIKCESDSEPPALYNIRYGSIQMNSDVKVGFYKIDHLTIAHEGDYTCIASNPVLNKPQSRTVKVLVAIKPNIIESPKAQQTVNEGLDVRINCRANGRPPPQVFWTKDDKNITVFDDGVISNTYGVVPKQAQDRVNVVNAALIFTGIRPSDEGMYKCFFYNGAGKIDSGTKYTVNYKPKFKQALQNFNVTENSNNKVTFTCVVEGKPNDIKFRWYFNGAQKSVTDSKLVIGIPKRGDNGEYQCEAENDVGSRKSTIGVLVVTYPPQITFTTKDITVDVNDAFTLECKAEGMPKPTFEWTKEDDKTFKKRSESFKVKNVKPKDKGNYLCTVKNTDGDETKSVKVLVRHAPIIVTTSPAETKIGVSVGMTALLNCGAEAFPLPDIMWSEEGSDTLLTDGISGYKIESSKTPFGVRSQLSFTVQPTQIGKSYICKATNNINGDSQATNNIGSDSQVFQVLNKGKPEPPIDIIVTDTLLPVFPLTVNVTLSWTPGFSGGYPVKFILLYKEIDDFVEKNYLQLYIGDAQQNTYVFENRKPGTRYKFAMQAQNELGKSSTSKDVEFTTTVAPEPVASFEVKRRDDTSVTVHWFINKKPEATASRTRRDTTPLAWDYGLIRYRIVSTDGWLQDKIANIPNNGSYVVTDLQPREQYEFYFVLYDTSGEFATPVGSGSPVTPGGQPRIDGPNELSKTDIIAIAVGCGGAILIIIIIILFIMIHRRSRNKNTKFKNSNFNSRVQVEIPVSTMKSGHSDVVRASYVNGEDDDPFSMNSTLIDDHQHDAPPPEYNSVHHFGDPNSNRQHRESPYGDPVSKGDPTPSYTSFGRLPKKSNDHINDRPKNQSKSMISLTGSRSAEISRGDEQNRRSLDNLDEYNKRDDSGDPLIQKRKNDRNSKNERHSRGRLSSEDDLPEPPPFMRDALRSPPSDEGHLNRAPGAFGDRIGQRYKKPQAKTYNQPPPPIPQGRSDSPTPSSVASSKPYRSDNEYIDDQEDKYVGYLV